MDTSSGCVPLCINFQDASTNATGWAWDFGDGVGTSTAQFPFYCYSIPGLYTVTLTATFPNGTGTASGTVTVLPQPLAAFSWSNTATNTITFTDQSGNAVSWAWDFGDNTTSTQQNPVHTYAIPGEDTVTLVVFSSFGCSDTISLPILTGFVAVHDAVMPGGLELYPNPSNGIVTIRMPAYAGEPQLLRIENTMGKIIHAETVSGPVTIDLSANAPGIYFARLGNNPALKLVIRN